MGTKTISLADDAYQKLKAKKSEGESFSDVVRRLAGGVELAEYEGVLDEETAEELDANIAERREKRSSTYRDRVGDVVDELDG